VREKAEADVTGDKPIGKFWSGNEIRAAFLRFFESKKGADGQGHRRVRSSSLVPHGDPTLLFTNAGMNQFKDVFLGLEKRDYNRATTAQKCVRAGGKHNDLESVGFTKRHHTFFEMLGNFSFGDYFKKDAIAFAWELVTSPEWFNISKDKLYVTIFGGAEVAPGTSLGVDEEAQQLWIRQDVPAARIVPIPGLKENFWAMGDTGPCGPCSEIFYDMGPAASDEGHTDCQFPCDCGRYVEIWNLVFMQFNRYCQRERSGNLHTKEEHLSAATSGLAGSVKSVHEYFGCLQVESLPKPCVDTGMGLERVAAVLQGVISNYDTDLFVPLINFAGGLCDKHYGESHEVDVSLRILADHSRAATFLISDDVAPSNEGRGYVLRKIIRRALRHGRMLGIDGPFLFRMAQQVAELMKPQYPELLRGIGSIVSEIQHEELHYHHTLKLALTQLDEIVEQLGNKTPGVSLRRRDDGTVEVSEHAMNSPVTLPGDLAFKLYDTYGLSLDLLKEEGSWRGFRIDEVGFERAMQEQRTRARTSWKGTHTEATKPVYKQIADVFRTEPDFYFASQAQDCRIEAIVKAGTSVSTVFADETAEVILDRTVIYAESGGQMADTGAFYDNSGSQLLAEVTGAYYPIAGLVAHKVTAKETLRIGDRVSVVADADRRSRIMRNHSGTHLVHAALRNILGTHVKQAGSLNAPERLRFDFSHFAHVDAEELRDIEQQVNDEIRFNTEIETNVTSLEDALASGALAFFGDKYPEHNVRVVTIPDSRAPRGFYSKELCGGTHVHRIGDIGVLKIVGEQSVAAGVRRIEAVTGIGALEHYQQQAQILTQVASQLNVGEDAVLATVEKLSQTVKQLEKELEAQKRKGALSQLDELVGRAQMVKGIKVIAEQVENVDREGLRQLVDSLRQKLGSGVVALGMPENGKVALIAGVTKDLTAKVHAGKLIQALAKQVGGSGGGRPDLAEAGGKDTTGLKTALQSVPSLLEPLL
jgi:alanyl-tRNA synthetase